MSVFLFLCVCECVCPPSPQVSVASSSQISKNKPKCQDKELASLHHSVTHTETRTHLLFALSSEEGGRVERGKKKQEIILQDDAVTLFLVARDCLLFFCACSWRLKHIFTRLCSYSCGVPLTAFAQRDNCRFLGGSEKSLLFSSISLVVCVHSRGKIMQLLE